MKWRKKNKKKMFDTDFTRKAEKYECASPTQNMNINTMRLFLFSHLVFHSIERISKRSGNFYFFFLVLVFHQTNEIKHNVIRTSFTNIPLYRFTLIFLVRLCCSSTYLFRFSSFSHSFTIIRSMCCNFFAFGFFG